jgi:hypothetical protein
VTPVDRRRDAPALDPAFLAGVMLDGVRWTTWGSVPRLDRVLACVAVGLCVAAVVLTSHPIGFLLLVLANLVAFDGAVRRGVRERDLLTSRSA